MLLKFRQFEKDKNGSFVSFGGTKNPEEFKDVVCNEVSSNEIEYDKVDLDAVEQPFEVF